MSSPNDRLVWIDERDAVMLHERLLAEHGGAEGLREAALLQSALARPRQYAAYADARDILTLAALYAAAIVQNHPFVDGNKRTGFLLGVLFLELNGYVFSAAPEDAANAVLALASGAMDERGYNAFLAANAKR
ncbi:type II toxin-antitoxin system death-on-curing family toxin [Methylocella silvestris]|uniref:Type II toxin-antitoxin system death-on-curing family toxin n=1 Tax=Methylocella silvestris TaxID=199596 RepID=A0A2J7TLW5_METSI|nr:type II toxin-antitoxin system death-on-curing family toxin [Methylocella silvestris]PNG27754.1 type II toxin-antitoxin system death-on-curing family toxin [Methylocella silvestris]